MDNLISGEIIPIASTSEVILDPTPLSTERARALTDSIRNAAEVLWVNLAQAHAGQAWVALGYSTWGDYVTAEFNISRSRSYQILDQAKVIQAIGQATPEGTHIEVSETAAREIKGIMTELAPRIEEHTRNLPPEEAKVVVKDMVAESRDKIRQERETAYTQADEEYDDSGVPDAFAGLPVPQSYTKTDDVALIRKNVIAAHDIYSSLSALAGLPEDLEPVIALIAPQRQDQVNNNLEKAQANLTKFILSWNAQKANQEENKAQE